MEPGKLKPRQIQAIQLLMTGAKIVDVAAAVGVDRSTIWKWKSNADFNELYQSMQQQLVDEGHGRLLAMMNTGMDALVEIMGDKDASTMARVQAVKLSLELMGFHKNRPVARPERTADVETVEGLIELLQDVPREILLEVIEGGKAA